MDRSLPTDPPDGPVNRIKQFFGSNPQGLFSPITPGDLFGTPEPPHPFSPELMEKIFAGVSANHMEGLLTDLAKVYEKDPNNSETVMLIAFAYLRLGQWENALAYLEWLQEIAPQKFADFTGSMIQQLRERLKK